MKHKEIEFSAEELIGSVEAFARHVSGKEQMTLRTKTFILPKRIKPIAPKEIRAIRHKLNVSQSVFALMLNVARVTAISWEKGRRHPTGAALRLLDLARKRPEVLV